MDATIEVLRASGPQLVTLDRDRLTLGKSRANDVVIAGDETVSRAHAVIERLSAGCVIRDLGSRNGTTVNGARISGDRILRNGDEIGIGGVRIVFRDGGPGHTAETKTAVAAPDVTPRERDVLVELCRPLFSGDLFTEPATLREIAARLHLGDPTVKVHLRSLSRKFGIGEGGARRRLRLANEAIRRGAVSLSDLRGPP